MVEIAVDKAVEQVTNVESASGTGGVQVTYDVDRTAVAHQVVKLWPISEFVDPFWYTMNSLRTLSGDAFRR